MSDPRTVMDQMTDAILSEDIDTLTSLYRSDAVVVAPEGSFKGLDQIAAYFHTWFDPFGDITAEISAKEDFGRRSLDEWTFHGTNDGPLEMPTGETLPATGKRVNVRGVDICTVDDDDHIVEHHIYYDQAELLGQLGLLPD
jgi:hypothetical protein